MTESATRNCIDKSVLTNEILQAYPFTARRPSSFLEVGKHILRGEVDAVRYIGKALAIQPDIADVISQPRVRL